MELRHKTKSSFLRVSNSSDSGRRARLSKIVALTLASLVSLASQSVSASILVDTTVGRTPVNDQSSRTQKQAIRRAMENALIKLTGKSDVVDYQGITSIVSKADNYLRSYAYTEVDNQLYYTAEFDQSLLENDVAALGLPVWGKRRPDSVLWFAYEDDNGERVVLGESATTPLKSTLVNATYDRGMPVSLPLLDLTDTLQVSIYDVWGLFPHSLESASERYGVDYLLGARLYRNSSAKVALPAEQDFGYALPKMTLPAFAYGDMATVEYHIEMADSGDAESGPLFTQSEFNAMSRKVRQGRYTLDWLVDREGVRTTGSLFGDSRDTLVENFINVVADALGDAYAILPTATQGQNNTVTLVVNNLDSYRKYIDVQTYINSLSVVDSVSLSKQYGETSEFTLTLLGSARDLSNVLNLESRLRPQTDTFGQPLEGFQFIWRD